MEQQQKSVWQRLEVQLGAVVIAGRDIVGHVDGIVMGQPSRWPQGILVRKGLALRRDILVPFETIEEATDATQCAGESEVRLRPTLAWLGRQPQIAPRLFADGVFGSKVVHKGQRASCRNGEVGAPTLVLYQPALGQITHFVIRSRLMSKRSSMVSSEWVVPGPEGVFVDLERRHIEIFPEYRSDPEITAAVMDEVIMHSGLPKEEMLLLDYDTHDGIAELRGHTKTEAARQALRPFVASLPYVLGVQDHTRSFERLAALQSPRRLLMAARLST